MRQRLAAVIRGVRSGASSGTIVVLSLALVCTVFGAGAMGRAAQLSDGLVWLWDSEDGRANEVNTQDGGVEAVSNLPESAGHPVEVTQTDEYLILHDLETGRMTSIDLTQMGFSGQLDTDQSGDFGLAMSGDSAVVVDRQGGEVRAIDPGTLQATGEALNLPGPLVGGQFDDEGVLWLGAPTQGTVVGITVADGTAEVRQTVPVADPEDDVDISVLDHGVAGVNRTDGTLIGVRGGEAVEIPAGTDLADARLPARTTGSQLAVTLPGEVLTVADLREGAEVQSFEIPEGTADEDAVAVPYQGAVYLPSSADGVVRAFTLDGEQIEVVTVPDAGGRLELEVREGHLFVNAPESGNAVVVGPSGEAQVVDEYQPPPGPGGAATPGEGGTPAPGQEGTAPRAPDLQPGTELPGPAPTPTPEPGGGAPPPVQPPVVPAGGSGTSGAAGGNTPGAPVPVLAQAGDGSVIVSWYEAFSPTGVVDGYVVSWAGGSVTVPGTERRTVVEGLANGTAYRFYVQATNAFGAGPTAVSPEVRPSEQAPPAPRGVAAEARTASSLAVEWEPVDARGEDVDYVVTAVTPDGGRIGTRTTTEPEIVLTALAPGQTYLVEVAARTGAGVTSEPTASEPVTLPEVPAPQDVWFEVAADSTVHVYWRASPGAVRYVVTPGASGARQFAPVTVDRGEPRVVDRVPYQTAAFPRAGDNCYQFTVQAVDADGNTSEDSEPSDIQCHRSPN
ncbi:fibronectin type III domain-containing protein [Marinactinospora rubrisoli]|uniref:Fibronectin type III domain-containing protein n=1 Tax=Marinactinospora rubrisoli TaxID=2715399 RepID=A0ABW2KQB7_9ACTN